MNKKSKNWNKYYQASADKGASIFVKYGAEILEKGGLAYDLGAGSGADTLFLLENGFDVVAIDKEPGSMAFIKKTIGKNKKLELEQLSFEEIKFKKSELIVSIASLPFVEKENFYLVWDRIHTALKKNGIFVGVIFGNFDTWAKENLSMTFLSNPELDTLIGKSNYEIEYFDELEHDGETRLGQQKHWHVYMFILRKT